MYIYKYILFTFRKHSSNDDTEFVFSLLDHKVYFFDILIYLFNDSNGKNLNRIYIFLLLIIVWGLYL